MRSVTVLLTQCLQEDFVGPPPEGEDDAPLPNFLHVGRAEAARLLGAEPEAGPLAQLMAWARADDVEIVHILDGHDAADPSQAAHLAQFGAHCLKGTKGARLVLDLESGAVGRPRERFVWASGLNDFEGTTLARTLEDLRAAHGGAALRVGVIGVWTEAKITFLLYDLKTRLGIDALATCSALTASASRAQHFNALDQLRRILGVEVFDGVGDFVEWLSPGAGEALRPVAVPSLVPALEVVGEGVPPLSERDTQLLGHLYRDCARLVLAPLGGGFSGATVLRVRAFDALGHERAPSVAKLGPRAAIAAERVAFERVEDILGNAAPAVRGFADLGDRAGIKYAFASMSPGGGVSTFKKLYARTGAAADGDIAATEPLRVLANVFDDILGRFHAATTLEPLDVLAYYGFAPRFAPGIRARVEALFGPTPEVCEPLPGYRQNHVAGFYEAVDRLPRPGGERHPTAFVHGDLNGANILIDAGENVWIIDFFHAHRGHALKDLAKLENDLLFLFTPVADEAALAQAIALSRALRPGFGGPADLRTGLCEPPPGVTDPALLRAFTVLRWLRARVARLAREAPDPRGYDVARLRYAVHTLWFDEADALQKRWAFAAACGLAEDVAAAAQAAAR